MKISRESVILNQLSNLVKIGFNGILADAIDNNSNEIVQLNRDQMRGGIAPDGGFLPVYESGRYADFKLTLSSYKAPTPIADLFLSGDFQLGMFLKIDGKDVKIYSKDRKAELLNRQYQPFGLNKESYEVIRPKVTGYYFKEVHEILNS